MEAFSIHLHHDDRLLPRTVGTYTHHLRRILTSLPAGAAAGTIDPADLGAYLDANEARGINLNTLRVHCSALTSYDKWLRHTGYTGPSPLDDIRAPRRPSIERDAYTATEADKIFDTARSAALAGDAGRKDQFDYAILSTLRYAGVRRTETLGLRTGDLDLTQRRLRVLGKGRRVRTVPVPTVYVETMQWYLSDVRPYLPTSEYLFANPRAQLAAGHRGATAEKTIERISHRYGNLAKVPGPHHPHRWRHTYATHLLREGVDVHVVQRLLGHASILTTEVYLHLMTDDLAKGVDKAFG